MRAIGHPFFHFQILGRTGTVVEVDSDGDLVILVDGDSWMLNPAAVTYVTEPEPGQTTGSRGTSSEDPLGKPSPVRIKISFLIIRLTGILKTFCSQVYSVSSGIFFSGRPLNHGVLAL